MSLEIKTVKDSDLIGKDAWTLYHLLSEAESLGWRISSFLIVLERETPAPPAEQPKTVQLPPGAYFDKSGHH